MKRPTNPEKLEEKSVQSSNSLPKGPGVNFEKEKQLLFQDLTKVLKVAE